MNRELSVFYKSINRKLKIISAYLQDEEIEWIIKTCRFKPINSFGKNYIPSKLIMEKKWIDEWSNSLSIENEKIKIILNDNELKIKQISTDLFIGRNPIELLKISKLIIIAINKDINLISLLGKDNFLRTFIIENNRINNCQSPIIMGLDLLRAGAIMIDVKNYLELNQIEIIYQSMVMNKCYISSLPLNDEVFFKIQNETNNNLNWLLKGN